MTQALPNPPRKVTLKLTSGSGDTAAPSPRVPAETLDLLLARARDQGIPLHPDTQIASLLAALRLRDDVPGTLY
ncbi:MAG: flagellar biosynthesis protein, partial [Dyella sp.]|uniref:flagellar biosynthesis protein n=1 Tax=Dyella sp. TaxID=1869338 RepID=UPI003F809A4E